MSTTEAAPTTDQKLDTSALKKFAQAARRQLLEQVESKLDRVLAEGSLARRESEKAVAELESQIESTSREQVIERVAYTWFNRFCALRFMDVNRYTRIGTVSPAGGFSQPEILMDAKQGVIDDEWKVDKELVLGLMDFIETVAKSKTEDDEVEVHFVTSRDEFNSNQQEDFFSQIQANCAPIGIRFSWKFDESGTIHARHIVTDHGWKILLDRGLDVFQKYDMKDAFSLSNRHQQHRSCKAFEVTYLRNEPSQN